MDRLPGENVATVGAFPASLTGAERATVAPRGAVLNLLPWRDATIATLLLIAAIAVGSGFFASFDPALLGYCAATLVASVAVVWRLSAFWRRPASAFYARALLAALLQPSDLLRTLSAAGCDLGAQNFIRRRSAIRWAAHLLLSLGTLTSFAITVPLVFGWMHFVADGERSFRMIVFNLPAVRFDVGGAFAWCIFHGLILAAVAVTLGALYFLVARLRRRTLPEVTASFAIAPLLLLLFIALSGLALPATRGWPFGFRVAALAHEASVIVLLVALPFSKLNHLLVRPLQLGVRAVRRDDAAWRACASCASRLAPTAQQHAVADLLERRGLPVASHWRLCPQCRRKRVAATQASLVGASFQPRLGAGCDREVA
ncbi:MAG: hypothetical protein HY270_14950 [Deltaproteobacteria bacterium]|nr:hypothetical protein [Deltaproteobacteria bacterium]